MRFKFDCMRFKFDCMRLKADCMHLKVNRMRLILDTENALLYKYTVSLHVDRCYHEIQTRLPILSYLA